MSLYPALIDTPASIFVASDRAASGLATDMNDSIDEIDVKDASDFPSSGGVVLIDEELCVYTAKSSGTLTGVTRGEGNSFPSEHDTVDANGDTTFVILVSKMVSTGISGSDTLSSIGMSFWSICCFTNIILYHVEIPASAGFYHHFILGYVRCIYCKSLNKYPKCSVCIPCFPPFWNHCDSGVRNVDSFRTSFTLI